MRAAGYALQAIEPGWFLIGTPLTPGYFGTTIAYRTAAALIGGYLAALIAKHAPMKYIYALAALGCATVVLPAFAGEDALPVWYRIVLAVVIPAGVVVGGRMRKLPSVEAKSQQDVAGDAAARGIAGNRE